MECTLQALSVRAGRQLTGSELDRVSGGNGNALLVPVLIKALYKSLGAQNCAIEGHKVVCPDGVPAPK